MVGGADAILGPGDRRASVERGPGAAEPPSPAVAALDDYARSAARLVGLQIAEEWWPGVLAHLQVLTDHATAIEGIVEAIAGQSAPPGRR